MIVLKKLLGLTQGLDTGMFPDRHASEAFIWDIGFNVVFTEGGVRKAPGFSAAFTKSASAPVRGMTQQLVNSGQRLYYGDVSNIYRWDAATVTTVGSGYSGNTNETVTTPASVWSMVDFGEWILATNGVDTPQIYKGSAFADMIGTPPGTAEILMKSGPHILALNTDNDIREVKWCDQDNPDDWVTSGSNTAGDFIMRDLNSRIVCAKPLGNLIAVYGTDSMAVISSLGAPFIFGYKMALNGIGAVSKDSVVTVGRLNYGLGIQGFFRTDGSSFQYIDVGAVRQTFLDEVNTTQMSKVVAVHNEEQTEVVWYYSTTGGEPDRGISFNYMSKAWGFRDYGRTSAIERNVFAYPVSADSAGQTYFENFGVDANGVAFPSQITSRPYAFEDDQGLLDEFIKYIDTIQLGMKTRVGAGLYLELALIDTLGETQVFNRMDITSDPMERLEPMASGRYAIIRIGSDKISDDWSLKTMVIHGTLIGKL